jgi:hypothetical protein
MVFRPSFEEHAQNGRGVKRASRKAAEFPYCLVPRIRALCAPALFAAVILVSSCGKSIRSKEEVQKAIVARVESKSGLDVKSLDVTTTSVSFEKNLAYATVAFHSKGDPSVNSGMVMKYTLEEQGGKWVVTKVGDSQGNGMMSHMNAGHQGPGQDTLPPGHPPVGETTPRRPQ